MDDSDLDTLRLPTSANAKSPKKYNLNIHIKPEKIQYKSKVTPLPVPVGNPTQYPLDWFNI